MLRALPPIVAGILAAGRLALPLRGAAAGFALCAAAALLGRRSAAGTAAVCGALFFAGWCAAEIRAPSDAVPAGETVMEIAVDEMTARRGGSDFADGHVVSYMADGRAVRSGVRVRVSADSSLALADGDRVEALCRVRPFRDGGEGSYGRYMARLGTAGQVRLTPENVMRRRGPEPSFARALRAEAVRRVERLGLAPDDEAAAKAIAIGDRTAVTSDMRRRYSLSGASHLLAVSGLHVGFVFALVNLLLWWMPALRYGHLWRCAVCVAAIWLYAAVAGFSPSVTRAAVMFSVFQLSAGATLRFDTLNSLCFTACLMLLLDARAIFDAGFLLSFVSVAAIVEWGVPLYRALPAAAVSAGRFLGKRTEAGAAFSDAASSGMAFAGAGVAKRKRGGAAGMVRSAAGYAARWLWSGTAVAMAASAVTIPLVSHLFGTVSLWSVAAGPPAVLLSAAVLVSTLVWTVAPIGFLQPAAAWAAGTAAGALDGLTRICAEAGGMAFRVRIGAAECAAAYAVFILFTLWLWSRRDE